MTVLTFATNDLFVVRVLKSHVSNPDRKWQNTYEFVSNASGTITDLTDLASVLGRFETAVHNTFTRLEQVTIGTWAADSVPYNPSAFLTVPLDNLGDRDTTGELEPINVCWSVSRNALSGRAGHVFYRGVLSQADTSSPGGILKLDSPTGMATLLSDGLTSSGFDDYLGLSPTAPLGLALINKTGTNIRAVGYLTSAGVTILPVNHAWFNRTSP